MIKYREIIRLGSEKRSLREIEYLTGHSHHTIKEVLELATKNNLVAPLDECVTDESIERILYPGRNTSDYAQPDYVYIHSELAKPGVTINLLWTEYCEKCKRSGLRPYMSTQIGS